MLNNTQNWLSTAQQQASEALQSIIAPLATADDTSIAAALGMIALPLLTERSTTRLLSSRQRFQPETGKATPYSMDAGSHNRRAKQS